MADQAKKQKIIGTVLFILSITVLPAFLALGLSHLKTSLFRGDHFMVFNAVAGMGAMFIPSLFFFLALFIAHAGGMDRTIKPLTTRIIALCLLLPSLVLLGLLFDSYRRVDTTGITHNPVFSGTKRYPWKSLEKARIGVEKKKITSGKYSTREVAALVFTAGFPGREIDLAVDGDVGAEAVARAKRTIDAMTAGAPGLLEVVPVGPEEKKLLGELAEWRRKEINEIILYAMKKTGAADR